MVSRISRLWLVGLGAAVVPLLTPEISEASDAKISVVLTGQSLIQADIRVDTPSAVSTIRPLLAGDVVFTNLESTIVNKGEEGAALAPIQTTCYGPPEMLDALRDMGVNLFALSNNHSFDFGMTGLTNTIREVKARNLAYAGMGMNLADAAAPAYLHTPKGTVALISMASGMIQAGAMAGKSKPGLNEIRLEGGTPGVDAGHPNPEDARRILQSIREAAKHADLVVVYHHNHAFGPDFIKMFREELPERFTPPKWVTSWAHAEIDAGADIVVMHGAPVVHGVEIYRGKPIFYNLGNFIFNLPLWVDFFQPIVYESVIAHVEFQGKTLQSVTFDPIVLNSAGHGEGAVAVATRGLPSPAPAERAGYILKRLVEASQPMGTVIDVNGETAQLNIQQSGSPKMSKETPGSQR